MFQKQVRRHDESTPSPVRPNVPKPPKQPEPPRRPRPKAGRNFSRGAAFAAIVCSVAATAGASEVAQVADHLSAAGNCHQSQFVHWDHFTDHDVFRHFLD